MGHYISVRGWLDLNDVEIVTIKKLIEEMAKASDDEHLQFYNNGWVFPETQINGANYIFYGAEIRAVYRSFLQKQLEEIAQLSDDINGLFYIDDAEYESKWQWTLQQGNLLTQSR